MPFRRFHIELGRSKSFPDRLHAEASTRLGSSLEKQIEDYERDRHGFVKFLASTDVAMLTFAAAAAPLDLLDEIGRTGLLPLPELFDRAKCAFIPHQYLALAIAARLAGEHAARLSDMSNGEDPEVELLVDFEGAVFDRFQAIFNHAVRTASNRPLRGR